MTAFERGCVETVRRWLRMAEEADDGTADTRKAREWIKQCREALAAYEVGDGNRFVRAVAELYLDYFAEWDWLRVKPSLDGSKGRGRRKADPAAVRARYYELIATGVYPPNARDDTMREFGVKSVTTFRKYFRQ
jgi:hypothetical protein